MTTVLYRTVLRAAVRGWLRSSQYSWTRLPVANDSPHVHAPGHNPDRILITGDGASAGVGVLTHDLGLPGYLARSLTAITGRATDVDIVVTTTMTAETCLGALRSVRLSRFDVILLSLGMNETLAFIDPRDWSRDLSALLDYLDANSPVATRTVMLSVPSFDARRRFPRLLKRAADRHAARLNRISRSIIERHPGAAFVDFGQGDSEESDGSHAYQRWAAGIAPQISSHLPPVGGEQPRTDAAEESERQRALDELDIVDLPADGILDGIARLAKSLFGTGMAAVTIIDGERQFMASSTGVPPRDIPRSDAFCDVTIRRPQHFAVEDALLDSRYATNPMVSGEYGVRFYAGYPIETPDGHRIGALCIMDTHPREFSLQDAALLRDLAHRAQERLWTLSDDERREAGLV